jgi:hypothetical protein
MLSNDRILSNEGLDNDMSLSISVPINKMEESEVNPFEVNGAEVRPALGRAESIRLEKITSQLDALAKVMEPQNEHLLNALMASDRHFDQKISGFVMRIIYVYRMRVAIDGEYTWRQVIAGEVPYIYHQYQWTPSMTVRGKKFTYPITITFYEKVWVCMLRFLFMLCILVLATPYAEWVSLVPELNVSDNPYYMIFMTVINSTPILSWFVNFLRIADKNHVMATRINLLQIATHRVSEITWGKKEEKILESLVDEFRSLQVFEKLEYGDSDPRDHETLVGLRKQDESDHWRWRKYFIISVIWSLSLQFTYGIWIGLDVFSRSCNAEYAGVCALFVILFSTSIIRFIVPILIVFCFIFECDLVIHKIERWYRLHNGKVDVKFVCGRLQQNISDRLRMASSWQWSFLTTFILPILCMLMIGVATLFERTIVRNNWFFFIYCVHFATMGIIAFGRAEGIGSRSSSIRSRLHLPIACGEMTWVGTADQIESYKEYLKICYSGFEVMGMTMDKTNLNRIIGGLMVVITYLFDNVTNLMGK